MYGCTTASIPDSIQRVGKVDAFPHEYPGMIYAFNWALNGDGVTPLRGSAFRINKTLDLKVAGLELPKVHPLQVSQRSRVRSLFRSFELANRWDGCTLLFFNIHCHSDIRYSNHSFRSNPLIFLKFQKPVPMRYHSIHLMKSHNVLVICCRCRIISIVRRDMSLVPELVCV